MLLRKWPSNCHAQGCHSVVAPRFASLASPSPSCVQSVSPRAPSVVSDICLIHGYWKCRDRHLPVDTWRVCVAGKPFKNQCDNMPSPSQTVTSVCTHAITVYKMEKQEGSFPYVRKLVVGSISNSPSHTPLQPGVKPNHKHAINNSPAER